MINSSFNPAFQQSDLSSKVVAGLERISEVFKVLLWEKAKTIGLSPIQIQILIFIAFHTSELNSVSHLAKEFNVTKPTISDAVRILEQKELIRKKHSDTDSRRYSIALTTKGKQVVSETAAFGSPLRDQVASLEAAELSNLFSTLSQLIYKLHRTGLLSVQRTCMSCTYYKKQDGKSFCNLMQLELLKDDIRIDCPEHDSQMDA